MGLLTVRKGRGRALGDQKKRGVKDLEAHGEGLGPRHRGFSGPSPGGRQTDRRGGLRGRPGPTRNVLKPALVAQPDRAPVS